ncbi:hypothetical protein GDO86_015324 [Hymenochirus boettgeri]|uniref:GP-PDE domain-containing protein n=1 Tax=Hymenochirus boettgeri TaxID=247094 RepID=A0A8T2JYB5_9PIPI|nr:hypothetical protein GDO86_015324 [Hymenochirus boettgeri]
MVRGSFWPSCCQCLYTCTCKRNKDRPNGSEDSTLGCIWVLLVVLVFFITLVWMLITLTLGNDMHNFNEEVFRVASLWMDWSIIFITVAAVLLTFSSILMLVSFCLLLCRLPLHLHWVHMVLLILCTILVILGCIGLSVKWREEWQTVYIYMQATLPFLHIGAVIGFSILSWVLAGYFWRRQSQGKCCSLEYFLIPVYVILLGALYTLPLYIESPCLLKRSDLPPKPQLIGHRGAPMLAPENTMMSFDRLVKSGIGVFESDVTISLDGVPFLMHDSKLLRTTNIKEVFPEQSYYNSSNFTWEHLTKLNAGSWYLQKNPFKTVSCLTPADQEEIKDQKIPTLETILKKADKHNISVIFDLYELPGGHPYKENYINLTLEAITNSSIRPELILWLPDDKRREVMDMDLGFRQIFGPLKQDNYTMEAVNMPYNISLDRIRSYRQKNITVNLYVINEPWLFSYAWCAGATSVTTNACHLLKDIQRPKWVLDPEYYLIIWLVTDILSFLHVIWAFVVQRKCLGKNKEGGAEVVRLVNML